MRQFDTTAVITASISALGTVFVGILTFINGTGSNAGGGPTVGAGTIWGFVELGVIFVVLICFVIYAIRTRRSTRKLDQELQALKSAASTSIRMIDPRRYLGILKNLATRFGKGELLLFNIELNTFYDNDKFDAVWEKLGSIPDIQYVKLALPPRKFAKWQRIVTGVRAGFFGDPVNGGRFVACRFEVQPGQVDDRIGFALYKSYAAPTSHSWGALFLLNRPFVKQGQDGTFDYLHILEYEGAHETLGAWRGLWDSAFSDSWSESATSIRLFHEQLNVPVPLERLLREHQCDQGWERAETVRRVVGCARSVDDADKTPAPRQLTGTMQDADGTAAATLKYHRTPSISGPDERLHIRFRGLSRSADAEPLPCIIWVPGFGDSHQPELAQVLSDRLSSTGRLVEVFIRRSGEEAVKETTCSRVTEDIREVLNYASEVPVIDRDRIGIIGISLSGFCAAQLARVDHRIKSLVMVCPPFDVIDMLDSFRRHRFPERGARVPTFDDFLKARPELRMSDWDLNEEYCSYFNHTVSVCHMVDIATKGIVNFRRDAFLGALAEITHTGRKVGLVYGENDCIVRAPENIPHLERALASGQIQREFFYHRPISLFHYFPKHDDAGSYPFKLSDKKKLICEMVDAINACLGFAIDAPAGSVDTESRDSPQLRVAG